MPKGCKQRWEPNSEMTIVLYRSRKRQKIRMLSLSDYISRRSSAVSGMSPERLRTLYSQHCVTLVAIYWPYFLIHRHSPEGSSWQHIDRISDIYQPNFHSTPSVMEFPRAIGFVFGMGQLEWLGNNLVKITWWSTHSYGHNTSTWQTATSWQQMPS